MNNKIKKIFIWIKLKDKFFYKTNILINGYKICKINRLGINKMFI